MCKFDGFHHSDIQEIMSEYKDLKIFNTRSLFNAEIKSRIAVGAYLLKKQNKPLLKKLKKAQQEKLKEYKLRLGEGIWVFPAEDLKSNTVKSNEFPILNNILKRACVGLPINKDLYVYISSPSYTDELLLKLVEELAEKSINKLSSS